MHHLTKTPLLGGASGTKASAAKLSGLHGGGLHSSSHNLVGSMASDTKNVDVLFISCCIMIVSGSFALK